MSTATSFCARHPNVPTALRCGKCETLICPRCMVQTPVGARCRDCARVIKSPVYSAAPVHLLKAIGAAVVLAAAGAIASLIILSVIPIIFVYILALAGFGYVMGEGVSIAANRKRGRTLQIVAIGGILIAFGIVIYLGGPRAANSIYDLAGWGLAAYMAFMRLR
ncbi:MAG: hypothetical protein FJ319_02435 [SAR202 cluster bacterium]|nr:hypothetical protein [SAR202 cluster bacterium]